jgi:hypothetical protein
MSELSVKWRAKYPGAYDDMTDTDLDKAILAKHPEYKDLAEKQEQATTVPAQKSSEITLKPEQYGIGEEQAQRLKTLQKANAQPISEPTSFTSGFAKSIADYAKGGFGFSSADLGSMLESAAHPQSLGDFLQLLVPGEVKAAGALNRVHEPLPSIPRGNLSKIAEAAVKSESPALENIRRNAPFGEGSIMPSESLPTELRPPAASEKAYPNVNFREDRLPPPSPDLTPVGSEASYNAMFGERPLVKNADRLYNLNKKNLGIQGLDELEASLPVEMKGSFNVNSLEGLERAPNASGESAASTEALSRQFGMKSRGDKYVVYDRAGNEKPLIGPEAVDYQASKGETYGIKRADGSFVTLEDNGGRPASKLGEYQDYRKSEIQAGRRPFSYNEWVDEEPAIANEMAPPQQPQRESLLAGETGSLKVPGFGEAPKKPRYRLDTETGMGIPIDEAGNQIGPAVSPSGQSVRPELAQLSKYNDAAKMANESQKKSLWGEFRDANRAILTAFDFSPLGRQGKPFMLNKEYYTSLDDMFKSWGSQRAYEAVKDSITSHPNFQKPMVGGVKAQSLAERAGLDYLGKEEMFQSNIAEKLVPGVKRSERAYNAFLGKLRADSFNRMVSDAEAAGMNPRQNDVLLKQFGSFINDATGRGSLGKLERIAPILNETFFAPRLMASRINMYKRFLNPMSYSNQNPILRKQTLKSLVSTVGFGLSVGELAKLGGAKVTNDPYSSDFRKIKIGNTRIDPFSGFQQYAVGASKILGHTLTSTVTGKQFDLNSGKFGMPTKRSVAESFFANKLAPIPSFVWSWMEGKEFDGTPFETKKAILNRTVPIVMQDLYDIYQEDPKLFPPGIFKAYPTATKVGMGILPVFGEGMQTYGR